MSAPAKLSEKEAKLIMKKYGLHWSWDSTIDQADIKCACGEWFSNPSYGMVKKLTLVDKNEYSESFMEYKTNDLVVVRTNKIKTSARYVANLVKLGYIVVGDECYERVPQDEWFFKTYFNKKEFEEFVKKNPQYTKLSFDNFWRSNKFNTEKNMPVGHAYRVLSTNEVYGEGECPENCKYKIADKVVSFGFYQTPNYDLVKCPICAEVHKIGYWRTGIPSKLKRKEDKLLDKKRQNSSNE